MDRSVDTAFKPRLASSSFGLRLPATPLAADRSHGLRLPATNLTADRSPGGLSLDDGLEKEAAGRRLRLPACGNAHGSIPHGSASVQALSFLGSSCCSFSMICVFMVALPSPPPPLLCLALFCFALPCLPSVRVVLSWLVLVLLAPLVALLCLVPSRLPSVRVLCLRLVLVLLAPRLPPSCPAALLTPLVWVMCLRRTLVLPTLACRGRL